MEGVRDGEGGVAGGPGAAGLVTATGTVAVGVGCAEPGVVRAGAGAGLVRPGTALDAGLEAGLEAGSAAASPGPAACGRGPGPPAVSITVIPAVRASATPAATAAA